MTSPILAAVEAAVVAHVGSAPQRASVSFLGVEPIEVLRFWSGSDQRVYVSLGMARYPMTSSTQPVLAADGPRAELMLWLRDPTDAHVEVWRRLAVLAAAPSVEGVVYAAGMSVDLGEPLIAGSGCTGVVIDESGLPPIGTEAGPVAVLSVLPATSTELAWCRVRGSAALRERWERQGTDVSDLTRRAVSLE